jgi:FHA domain
MRCPPNQGGALRADFCKWIALEPSTAEVLIMSAHSEPISMEAASPPADTADETVSIELDFNAFADHVPPTQHARRVASATDPSVQDFADQALELATLRAELKRLNRDYEALQHTVQMRDMRLQALQDQLRSMRAQDRVQVPAIEQDGVPGHEFSSTLELLFPEAEITTPVHEAPGTDSPTRRLIPMGHEGEPIPLSRDIMTIGRAKDKDICIASRAVSRDHARLVLSSRSVTVFDMDSANGCFVNDEPVKRHRLREDDVLRIGDRSYRFANGG